MPKRTILSLSQDAPTPSLKKRSLSKRGGLKRAKRYPAQGTVGKPTPFPTRMVAQLKYVTTISVVGTAVPAQNYNIACNSIYDPDINSIGHQPYGHDTYSNIYNQYTVLRSTLKLTPMSTGAVAQVTYGVGIEDGTTSGANFDVWLEKPTYKAIAGDYRAGDFTPLIITWDRNKRFPQMDTYKELSAAFGANPAEMEVFNIVAQTASSLTSLGTFTFLVEVWYTCEMYELNDLGSS